MTFWRTTQQKELDWIEEEDGKLSACEFKWNPNRSAKVPKAFTEAYPAAGFQTITRENCSAFLL